MKVNLGICRQALDTLMSCGVQRVLTSGGAHTALQVCSSALFSVKMPDKAGSLVCCSYFCPISLVGSKHRIHHVVKLSLYLMRWSHISWSWLQGSTAIRQLVEQAQGRITIMAGGGVRAKTAELLVSLTGVSSVHASASG